MATELIIEQSTTGPETRSLIRDGVEGNYQVIFAMVRLIRESIKDHALETFAKGKAQSHFDTNTTLFGREGYSSHLPADFTFHTIFNYVKRNIAYTLDEAGAVETIKAASVTLSDKFGDCDDQAILIASLLGVLGFEDVRIAMTRYTDTDAAFVHVYTVVYYQGKRYIFDTTLPNAKLNDEIPPLEIKEIPVFNAVEGLDGFSGVFANALHYGKRGMKAGLEIIPSATSVLPLGFAAGTALNTGASMIARSTGESLSLNAIGSKINRELDKTIQYLLSSHIAYDSAKAYALQVAAQLNAVEIKTERDKKNYAIIKDSIKTKLNFINNFEEFAKINNIKCVYLDSRMILLAGVLVTGFTGYILYKQFRQVEI